MASAKKADMKSKAVSSKQASAVANFMKSSKMGGKASNGPKQPTPASNPVKDDDDDDQSQGM